MLKILQMYKYYCVDFKFKIDKIKSVILQSFKFHDLKYILNIKKRNGKIAHSYVNERSGSESPTFKYTIVVSLSLLWKIS